MTAIITGNVENLRMKLPEWEQRKIVHGDKITEINECEEHGFIRMTTSTGIRIQEDWGWYKKHSPQIGGYYVLYKDGYASYSPAEPFEEACVSTKPVVLDEFHFINEKWFEQFANAWHGRYNTIRWGSPAINAGMFSDMKVGHVDPDVKFVWLLGTHVARYFDAMWSSAGKVQQELASFMSPEPNEAKRATGDLGVFMGCRIFADRNAHLPTKSILLLRFKGEIATGHKLSGVTL